MRTTGQHPHWLLLHFRPPRLGGHQVQQKDVGSIGFVSDVTKQLLNFARLEPACLHPAITIP